MVRPRPSILSDSDIASLHDLMGQGLTTIKNFQDPQEIIQIRRFNGIEWAQVADFSPISVKLENQQTITDITASEARKVGTLRIFAEDLESNPVHVEDRFEWQGQVCKVTLVPGIRFGSVSIEFEMIDQDV